MRNVDARMLESEAGVRLHRKGVSYDKAFRLLGMARKTYDRWLRLRDSVSGTTQDRSSYICQVTSDGHGSDISVTKRLRYDGYPAPFRIRDIEIQIESCVRYLGKIAKMLGVHSGTDEASAHVLSDCASQFGMPTTAICNSDRSRIEQEATAKHVAAPRERPVNIWDHVRK